MGFVTGGSFPASLVPAQQRMTLNNNYLNFADGTSDWAQQYLPELYEQEVERYGNRTLSGFLRMVGAEMPMTSDQIIWSEQNRLHVAYNSCASNGANGFNIELAGTSSATCEIKVNQTIVVSDNATGLVVEKFIVTAVNQPVAPATMAGIVVQGYTTFSQSATMQGLTGASDLSMYVSGSEWEKGSTLSLIHI